MKKKREFEFVLKVSIGQYIPTGSFIHLLDPRIKILMEILLICTTVFVKSIFSLSMLLLIVILGLMITHVSMRLVFAPLRSMMLFMVILALIQIFAVPGLRTNANIIWQWQILIATDKSLKAAALLIFRFAVILLGLSMFSFSTSTSEFINGVENLLRPLQKINLPAHEFALVINIAVRFIPILVIEAERLMKAQASRGVDFSSGKFNFFKRINKILSLFVPLFLVSLKHAQNLIEAMESRCYLGGKGRTHFKSFRIKLSDYVATAIGTVIIASASILSFMNIDQIIWNWFSASIIM